MTRNAGWKAHLRDDPLPWLLEPANPSARYLALRHVLGRPAEGPDVVEARAGILEAEPAAGILAAQWPDGYWVTPDRGYTPRYRATVWQIMFLAQLGAPPDERIERACEFVWEHSWQEDGLFTPHQDPELDDLVNLNGNLLYALAWFGYAGDLRVRQTLDALARLDLAALLEAGQVDAVVKIARGLLVLRLELPPALATFLDEAVEFLARLLPNDARRNRSTNPRRQFGFPLAEEADLLEMVTVLGQLGAAGSTGVRLAREVVVSKQDHAGRWTLETVPGKMWTSVGDLGQANKWVTMRALLSVVSTNPSR